MEKKESTPQREARRRYEERNREERKQARALFAALLPRKDKEEMDEFLTKHKITKVDLVYRGYMVLKEEYEKNNK